MARPRPGAAAGSFHRILEQRLAVLGGIGRIEDEVLADRDHIGREVLGAAPRIVALCPRIFRPARPSTAPPRSGRGDGQPLAAHLPLLQQQAEDFEHDAAR